MLVQALSEPSILLVDDDPALSAMLAEYLAFEGCHVEIAANADQAEELLELQVYDLMVLDIMMPGRSGLELLQSLRPNHGVPVIMLTGRGGDIDRILGLEMGADDYLSKPCNPRELLARIRAVLRRAASATTREAAGLCRVAELTLDAARREASLQNLPLELTSAEFNVLKLLMESAGKVVSKAELTEKVLHRKLTAYDRSIDVHVSRVRQKLAQIDAESEYIKTVRGEGYQLVLVS